MIDAIRGGEEEIPGVGACWRGDDALGGALFLVSSLLSRESGRSIHRFDSRLIHVVGLGSFSFRLSFVY